ncbi:MAG: lytic transglycosylase domain-containing protein [Nocardioides sp.]|uniref:aggregation-promoting factor C-terminal-like domain-containing protein n=1 Tax=Nocardioides sp. TaxID=35761 RepID=UPI0039E6437D
MSRAKPVPRHKAPPRHRAPRASRLPSAAKVTRNTVVMTSLAVAATTGVVASGVASSNPTAPVAADVFEPLAGTDPTLADAELQERAQTASVSRSDRRTQQDPAKVAVLSGADSPAAAKTEDLSDADPRTIAKALLPEFGFGDDQFQCLDSLYMGESGWRVDADNPNSSAYGIPQALPGSKMASAGADWATNPVTQIRWGLGYIADRYGTPCGAWSFKQGHGYY